MPRKQYNLVGRTFGRLVVIGGPERHGSGLGRIVLWTCECACGNVIRVTATALLRDRGKTGSCGCLRKDVTSARSVIHGESHPRGGRTVEYASWDRLKQVCTNPQHPKYPDQGGRGIVVCERWFNSYKNFLADMGRRPTAEHSLERKDVNGPYSPDNCRWATKIEKARNTRSNRVIGFNGQTRCLAEWAEITGISAKLIAKRIDLGWSAEKALTKAARKGKSEVSGEVRTARAGVESRIWRSAVQRRDGYACQRCKAARISPRRTGLATHHILNFKEHLDVRYSTDNGITLCKSCHLGFHAKYGRHNNTREQLDEWLGEWLEG